MNNYDEKIKLKHEQIKKLQKDVAAKKTKISKIQDDIKQLEAEKDKEFSRSFLKKLAELGINSPEQRNALIEKIEDFALEQEIEKSEKISVLPEEENSVTVQNFQNSVPTDNKDFSKNSVF